MNPSHVDLVSLRVFVSVAQSGSISAGAEQVSLSVGAVSKRIAELEAISGASLFVRLPTGVQLTVAGHALLHRALEVLQTVERLAADMDAFAQGLAGQVRVLATSSALLQGLPQSLASFAAAYPAVRIDLEERLSGEVVRFVLERKADLGIFTSNVPHDGLVAEPCGEDEMILIAPAGHVLARNPDIAFEEALQYDFVTQHDSTSLNGVLAQAATALGQPLRLRSLVRSYDGVCRMVAADNGLGLIPSSYPIPNEFVPRLARVHLRDAWARRRLLVGVRDANAMPAAIKGLRNHLLEHPLVPA